MSILGAKEQVATRHLRRANREKPKTELPKSKWKRQLPRFQVTAHTTTLCGPSQKHFSTASKALELHKNLGFIWITHLGAPRPKAHYTCQKRKQAQDAAHRVALGKMLSFCNRLQTLEIAPQMLTLPKTNRTFAHPVHLQPVILLSLRVRHELAKGKSEWIRSHAGNGTWAQTTR